jgi:DNA topoisomerase-1
MRTDSNRIANEAIKATRKLIGSEYGKDYVPAKPNVYSSKKSAQDAHEAIRPTDVNRTPEKMKKHLTAQQFKLYSLIWNRFVASQMPPAVFDVETVTIEAGKYELRASAQKIKFDGYLKVYHEAKENGDNGDDENGSTPLPDLSKGDKLKLKKLDPTQSFTKPPARFSEAMLVKELEADGIGRPSTYASIISTLRDRQYVELKEKRMYPTDLGQAVNKILTENFDHLFNVKFTAEMEKELDQIEEGNDDWVKVLKGFYKPFAKHMDEVKGKAAEIRESMTEETKEKCEKCGSPMVIKWGRNGRFLACSAYPECRSTRPLPEEEAATRTDEVCEKCGSPMVIKTGRFGRFLACSAYPDCKNTKKLTLGIDCPREGCKGQLMEKTTRGRRVFYGCSAYPKCDYALWDMPVKKQCPACKHPFMVAKSTKAKGEFYKCPQCKHEEAVTPAEESVET